MGLQKKSIRRLTGLSPTDGYASFPGFFRYAGHHWFHRVPGKLCRSRLHTRGSLANAVIHTEKKPVAFANRITISISPLFWNWSLAYLALPQASLRSRHLKSLARGSCVGRRPSPTRSNSLCAFFSSVLAGCFALGLFHPPNIRKRSRCRLYLARGSLFANDCYHFWYRCSSHRPAAYSSTLPPSRVEGIWGRHDLFGGFPGARNSCSIDRVCQADRPWPCCTAETSWAVLSV